MATSAPLVTVVALCYNHEKYVIETVASIVQQQYEPIEFIIIDDASKDASVSVIQNYIQQHNIQCKLIVHEQNMGICKSLNESLQYATGKYYKVIACDDILLPHCIETLVHTLETDIGGSVMAYADVTPINEHGELFGKTPFEERGWLVDSDVPSGNLFVQLAKLCFIPAPSVLMKTAIVRELKFDESLLFEDWDMWLRVAKKYSIKGIAQSVVKYRIHNNSMYISKSPTYRDAELKTAEKHLGENSEADVYLKTFIYENSILLYLHNGLRPLHWLWKRFLIKKSISNFLHVLLALAGIKYQQKEKWRKIFQGV